MHKTKPDGVIIKKERVVAQDGEDEHWYDIASVWEFKKLNSKESQKDVSDSSRALIELTWPVLERVEGALEHGPSHGN